MGAGMTGGCARTGGGGRGWVPASAMTTDGEGMDSCPPSLLGQALLGNCGSGCGNDGWVREDGWWGKGMGPRIREGNGWGRDGFPPPSSRGQALLGNCGSGCGNDGLGREDGRWGKGMGPRIREDNVWGRDGLPSPVFVGQALRENDGSGMGDHKGRPYGGRERKVEAGVPEPALRDGRWPD